jgi:uncharacterized protein YqgC (DUF456 family)
MQVKSAPTSRAERVGQVLGLVVAIAAFEIFAAPLFAVPAGGGINFLQVLCAGVAAGLGVLVGYLVGRTIARRSNRSSNGSV